jgi:hypothetical protein
MVILTTSSLQQAVGQAFTRIGLDHVEEYLIPTNELVENHGVQLATKTIDILSLDIAVPKDKLGIEVDGPGHFVHVLDSWLPQEETRLTGFVRVNNVSWITSLCGMIDKE